MRKELTVATFVIAVYSCNSEANPEMHRACIPGESISCSCSDDLQGIQKCNSEGINFGECICEEDSSSSGQTENGTSAEVTTSGDGSGSSTNDVITSSTGDGVTSSTSDTPMSTTGSGMDTQTSTGDSGSDTDVSPPVEPQALVVKANGEKIGYLELVSYYTISIWDDVKNVRFSINDTTGYLVGGWSNTFENATCSGYGISTVGGLQDEALCNSAPAITHPIAGGSDGDYNGFSQATKSLIMSGKPTFKKFGSSKDAKGVCTANNIDLYMCFVDLKETNLVPTSFPLPITISQE